MNAVKISESQYTKENKIAPGMNGTFEINIEPQDTQVSIRYDITIDSSKLSSKSIKLNSIVEKNNDNTIIRTLENTYTGIITLEKINENYFDSIEVTFTWENDEENNEEDTKIGVVENFNLEIPIVITFCQYFGEEVEEFKVE